MICDPRSVANSFGITIGAFKAGTATGGRYDCDCPACQANRDRKCEARIYQLNNGRWVIAISCHRNADWADSRFKYVRHDGIGHVYHLRLDPGGPVLGSDFCPPARRQPEMASQDDLSRVYRWIVRRQRLALQSWQVDHLLGRGFTREQVALRGYRNGNVSVEVRCESPDLLRRVPGLDREGDEFYLRAGTRGRAILIPGRFGRRIDVLRHRNFDAEADEKYTYVGRQGQRVILPHLAGPLAWKALPHEDVPRTGDDLWITEGELSADLAADRFDCLVLGLYGVTFHKYVSMALGKLSPRRRVVFALDLDKKPTARQAVYDASRVIYRDVRDAFSSAEVRVATWDRARFKDLGEVLAAGRVPDTFKIDSIDALREVYLPADNFAEIEVAREQS